MSESSDELRVSLTLPGSASLGAFQAGAVSALTVILRSLTRRGVGARVDAIGGASAGSIVGLLAAHGLLTGRDVPSLLSDAWVDEVGIDVLRGGTDAPLTVTRLHDDLVEFLRDLDSHPADVHEPYSTPIALQVGLTSLLGFTIPVVTAGGESSSLSFVDWSTFDLQPGHGVDALVEPHGASPLDVVLASASHPLAFAPRALDRSGEAELYEQRGIDNVAGDERLWYTDGGVVESRPVGRVLAAARERAGDHDGRRLHLVVDPRSSGPGSTEGWRGDGEHRWIDGLRRSTSIVPTQALHDDIRGVARVNERLERFDDAVAALRAASDEDVPDDAVAELRRAAGLDGKERIDLEIVSPLQRATDDDVDELLAGDFVGAFGGFLDRRLRQSDYALGWRCTADWMPDALGRNGVDDDAVADIADELASSEPEWLGDVELAGDGVDQLDARGRWRMALLAARFGRVVWSEATPSLSTLLPTRSDR